ncbi:MAG: 2Fe-2S iron-sulfur cluster-binding protein [Caulobacterales bacterium]
MVSIIFKDRSGALIQTDARAGISVMEAARERGISGIAGDCGGEATCGTCHVYVPEAAAVVLPEPTDIEAQMLEFVFNPSSQSRLSCQLVVSEELDGMIFELPASE